MAESAAGAETNQTTPITPTPPGRPHVGTRASLGGRLKSSPIIASRVEDIASLRPEWECLLSQSPADTIFLSWEWQSLWWRVFGTSLGQTGTQLHALTGRDADGLIGIAPLLRVGRELHFSGGDEIADFLDYLATPGREAEMASLILDHADEIGWDLIDLRNLREESLGLGYLVPEARKRGLLVEVEQEDVSPKIVLPPTWEAYQESLSKKDRHELRRKLRRLQSAGQVTWGAVGDPVTRRADVAEFIKLHRLSADAKADFMTAEMEEWFQSLVEHFEPLGKLRLYFLEIDGVRAASVILFDYKNRFLLYNSGYDPEFARLSVGLALKAYCIHDAIALGRETLDCLQGSESYKYDLGAKDAPIYHVCIRPAGG